MTRITTHPGEVLREEFMIPLNLSANALAMDLRIPANRVSAVVNGTRSVTADTALRLGRYFGTTAQFWMNLQTLYDLSRARAGDSRKIESEIQVRETA